jgi:hypothetical protein
MTVPRKLYSLVSVRRYNCEIWYMDEYLFVRINTNNINPLIKEFLNVNKSLHDEGFYTRAKVSQKVLFLVARSMAL